MNKVRYALAVEAIAETLRDCYEFPESEAEYVDQVCQRAVQNLIDSGVWVGNEKKLSAQDVRDMRAAHKRGTSQADLARQYSVNSATVSRIVRGIYF